MPTRQEILAALMAQPNVTTGAANPALKVAQARPTGSSVDRNRMMAEILSTPVQTPQTQRGDIAPVDAQMLTALANIGTSVWGAKKRKQADAQSRELLARELELAQGRDPFASELQPIAGPVISGRANILEGPGSDEATKAAQAGVLPFVQAQEATQRAEQPARSGHDLAALLDPRASQLAGSRIARDTTPKTWSDPYTDESTGSLVQKNATTGELREVSRAPSVGGANSRYASPQITESGRIVMMDKAGGPAIYADTSDPWDSQDDPVSADMQLITLPDGSVQAVNMRRDVGRAQARSEEVVDQDTAVSGAAVRTGAETAAREGGVSLTPGQRAVDTKFADDYVQWQAIGGFADVQKNLSQLQEVRRRLESGTESLTGTAIGNTPRNVLAATNPDALNVMEQVEEVVQRNLRLILGAQFTEKEGERLIARAYNPRLPEAENAERVARLARSLEDAAKAKDSAAQFFAEKGTLSGWNGKLFTLSDFNAVLASSTGDVESQTETQGDDPLNVLTPEQRERYGL